MPYLKHRERIVRGAGTALASLLLLVVAGCGDSDSRVSAPSSSRWTVDAGAVKLKSQEPSGQMVFHDAAGAALLLESTATGAGPVGALGLNLGPPPEGNGQTSALTPLRDGMPAAPPSRDQGWVRATQLIQSATSAGRWAATLATTSPAYTIHVSAQAAGDGVIAVTADAVPPEGVQAIGIAFFSDPEERFFGFGERSNGVNQAGRTLEHYVGEGPYQDREYLLLSTLVPRWGIRWREDATYFPIPWLLSSRGYGVLIDNDELSYHRLRSDDPGAWSMEVESTALRFRVFGGPTPAAALQRYTAAVGRQPGHPPPWFFGPWVQPDTDDRIGEFLTVDVPTSVTPTFVHYLPCGAQQGHEQEQIDRTAALNAKGTAVLTYFNPMICTNYHPAFDAAEVAGALIKDRLGQTYVYPYTTTTVFTVSQFDFGGPQAAAAYMRHHVLTHPDDPQAVARDDQYMFGPDLLVAPVFTAGATSRELYLPAGRWVEFWRSVRYEEASGGFSIADSVVIIEGGRSVTVAASIDEIPLFVRAGAQIPMLPPDVFTLAEHGTDPAIVHLSDRINEKRVLSFPD